MDQSRSLSNLSDPYGNLVSSTVLPRKPHHPFITFPSAATTEILAPTADFGFFFQLFESRCL